MNVHEYQAKQLLKRYGVPVLKSVPVFSAEEAGEVAYNEFVKNGSNVVVLKSQVHAGGRGKGVVRDFNTNEEKTLDGKPVRGVNVVIGGDVAKKVYDLADATFNNKLVTIQTGENGAVVRRMMIEDGAAIEKEFYLSMLMDRSTGKNMIMASTEGGVEIEHVAEHTPELILKEWINPNIGFQGYQARRLVIGLGLSGDAYKNFISFINKLVTAYLDLDCSMLEINPMVLTKDNQIIALDAKVDFDDNAMFRHPEFAELRDFDEEEPLEVEASKYHLNYIKLDGNVGCMVNGAGLAMATMDMIKESGGFPANFLDVGGGANVDRIANAFRIMLSDENVKAVFINIFGGIVRCDKVADGIVQALKTIQVDLPVIVRLDGTRAEEGAETLRNSGMKFLVARNFNDASTQIKSVFN